MASKYGFMAKLGVDTSAVVKAVGELETQLRNSKVELKYINDSLKLDDNGNVAELGQKFETLSEIIKNTKSKLDALKKTEDDVQKAFESGKITENQYTKFKNEVAATESSLRQYESQLKATEKQIDRAGKSTDGLSTDTKELKNEIKSAEKSAADFGDIFKANILSDVVMTGVRRLTDEFVNFAKQGVELASSLSEVQNVVDVTFGTDANVINEWSKNAVEAYGLSELAAKQYTGTLGAMLKSSGLASDAVLQMSQDLTGLAGDLASFYNLDIGTAFEKIRSGISGETEPLKQLGIDMSVANMEAFALAQGIEKAWRNMSQAEKAQLRYSYLLQQTADAQGDFVRTSDSLANQQRIAQLNFENLSAELGKELLPVVNELFSTFNDKVPDISDKIQGFSKLLVTVINYAADNSDEILVFAGTLATLKGGFEIANTINTYSTAIRSAGIAMGSTATAATALAAPIGAIAAIAATAIIVIDGLKDSQEGAKQAAENAVNAYDKQKEVVSELETELKSIGKRIDELNNKDTLTITEEQELINLKQQNEQLEIQIELEKRLLEIKKETAEKESVDALMSDDPNSMGSIKHVEMWIGKYQEYEESIKSITEQYNQAVIDNDKYLMQYYADGQKTMQAQQKEYEQLTLTALNDVIAINNEFTATTEEGIAAKQAVSEISEEVAKLFNITLSTAEQNVSNTSFMAEYYKKMGETSAASRKSFLEQRKLDDEELEKGLKALEIKYNTRQIIDQAGNKDEAAYMAERKKYLEEHINESSELWWKYYDEIADFEKKSAEEKQKALEEEKKASEKAYEDAEKARIDAIKKSWDTITRQRERGLIDEEQEYKLKAQLVKEHCNENEDTWDEYYSWLFDFVEKREKEITDEQVDAWEKNSKELADSLSNRYKDLVKQKEKVRQELLNIDLSETVKDKNGKDVTILTNLDEEIKKINRYKTSLQKLKETGAQESLIAKIQELSYEDGQRQRFIDVLLGLSEQNRNLYYSDWERMQKAAESAASAEVSSELDKLNQTTADAVTDIFGQIPQTAYQQGVETAKSYLQGIIDSMGGINNAAAIQNILTGTNSGVGQNRAAQQVVSTSTPIMINLNDKQYIQTTIGELINQGVITGGNTFNL